jgi:hypothetical protein
MRIRNLEDREHFVRAVKNTISDWGDPNMPLEKITSMTVSEAFVWDNTPEGWDYWNAVNKNRSCMTRIVKLTGIVKYYKEIELEVEVPSHLEGREISDYIDADNNIQDAINKAYENAPLEMYLDSDEITLDYE